MPIHVAPTDGSLPSVKVRARVRAEVVQSRSSIGNHSRPALLPAALLPAALLMVGTLCMSFAGCHRAQPSAPSPEPPVPAVAPPPKVAAPVSPAQRGARLYATMCSVCHGADGEGYRADRAPALHRADFLGVVSDDFLRRAIMHGRKGSTMSAWSSEHGGPLTAADVGAVVAFLRTWHQGPNLVLDRRPPFGDAARGSALYGRECERCHGARGVGGQYVQIGNTELLMTATDGMLREAIRNGRSGTPMPAFGSSLGEQGVEDVAAYLRSLGASSAPSVAARHAPPPPLPLGKVPLNPRGKEPRGFVVHPATTPGDIVHREFVRKARMALLDARAPSDYINEHIAGAVSVPFYDPSPYFDDLPKNTWLVCYCSCPLAESGALAQKLLAHGFRKVTVLAEGLPYWKSKHYATHSGEKP